MRGNVKTRKMTKKMKNMMRRGEEIQHNLWQKQLAGWLLTQSINNLNGEVLFQAALPATDHARRIRRSPLFDAVTTSEAPQLNYYVNETPYEFEYYLADGIYPKWMTLVQSIKHPDNDAEVYFSTKQEVYYKDVERAFGILQARFGIIRQPARGWERESLSTIMLACIILHNMIVKDERDDYYNGEPDDDDPNPNRSRRARARIYDGPNFPRNPRTGHITMTEYMSRY
ncbi:uncharacterized protein LOC112184456 [Rosa chinensis]|uniref:uncharacterized protein LOC112184456 n=1 Tax=Rosa chinensis TaxID=74649 RepID=UPI000D0963D6|nr:uncharacterized protein LOC112184456 [Rosa chinensis]